MNDEFLYKNRPPVRKEFAEQLHRQLAMKYPDIAAPRKRVFSALHRPLIWKVALAVTLLLLALTLVMPTGVRAQMVHWVKTIAGFQVEERSEPPIKDGGEARVTPVASGNVSPTPGITPTVVSYPPVDPRLLFTNPPFAFGTPQYIPEGFSLGESAAVANSKSWVSWAWVSQNAEIMMLVEKQYPGYPLPAGMEGAEEIQINGKPALLIHGWWDENNKWDLNRRLELHWMNQDLHYRLVYSQRSISSWAIEPISGDAQKILGELIRMAESVP